MLWSFETSQKISVETVDLSRAKNMKIEFDLN